MSSSDDTSSAAASLAPLVTESRTLFTFMLDHIKRLDSTTNYLSWRNQVSIHPHVMHIYKYVDGSTPKPTNTTHLAIWNDNDYKAKSAIITLLSEDFIYLARDASTAEEAWNAVEDHRDSRNSLILHYTVAAFFSTNMQDTLWTVSARFADLALTWKRFGPSPAALAKIDYQGLIRCWLL